MNKPKVKQIYLLLVAIFGILALSVYSTYAIFTLEKSTDNIVSIRTPNNLKIAASTYEYKQVIVPKDSYITTDFDIYNNLEDELCYSVWYKTVGNETDKIKVYENTTDSLTTSSTISPLASKRIKLLITNDSDNDLKVNIGLVYEKNEGTCALNIGSDRLLITSTVTAKSLANTIIGSTNIKSSEAGYLTYKALTKTVTLDNTKTYYVANNFTYSNELFTLTDPEVLPFDNISNYPSYYLCLDGKECETIYHIIDISDNTITKYDMYVGYLAGESGLRKVNNDYYYYGDNPNNFIYYNCANELDANSCELWRIMGFYYDSESNKYLTKIISNDYQDKHIFDNNSNIWNQSSIDAYLRDYDFKNNNLASEITFKEENVLSLDTSISEIELLPQTNKAKVTIMQLSDYLYASSCSKNTINEYDETCLKNNWLNKFNTELTMTTKYEEIKIDEETNEEIISDNNMIYTVGNEILTSNISESHNVRPVVYLKSRALLISGDGTIDNPYIIR